MDRSSVSMGAIGVGAAFGTLLRNLPVTGADALYRGQANRGCGMEAAVDCAFRELPDALGQLIQFAVLVLAVTAAMTIAGALLIALGWHRVHRDAADAHESDGAAGLRLGGVASLASGAALVMPGIWLAIALTVSLLG